MKTRKKIFLSLLFGILISVSLEAQKKKIQWISFEQLEDSLNVKPKKVFITFYADWCSYCKKMDQVAFKDEKVISLLNKNYYSVRMNSESRDTISFDGKKYFNAQVGKYRNPIHQIPLMLTSRKGYPFSLPSTLILDEKFRVKRRFFEYLSKKKLARVLK